MPARAVAVERVEHVQDRHQLGPGMQPPRAAQPAGRRPFHGAVADPAAADPGLGEAGDAFGSVVPGGPVQRRRWPRRNTAGSAPGSAAAPSPGPAPWAGRRLATIMPPSGSGNDAASAPASRSVAVLTTAIWPELCRRYSGRSPGDPVQPRMSGKAPPWCVWLNPVASSQPGPARLLPVLSAVARCRQAARRSTAIPLQQRVELLQAAGVAQVHPGVQAEPPPRWCGSARR